MRRSQYLSKHDQASLKGLGTYRKEVKRRGEERRRGGKRAVIFLLKFLPASLSLPSSLLLFILLSTGS